MCVDVIICFVLCIFSQKPVYVTKQTAYYINEMNKQDYEKTHICIQGYFRVYKMIQRPYLNLNNLYIVYRFEICFCSDNIREKNNNQQIDKSQKPLYKTPYQLYRRNQIYKYLLQTTERVIFNSPENGIINILQKQSFFSYHNGLEIEKNKQS